MPTALTYDSGANSLRSVLLAATRMAVPPYTSVPPDFAEQYPRSVSYAESRICSEIPMLANRSQDASQTLSGGVRLFDLGALTFATPLVVLERFALITPTGNPPASGTRWQYVKTTLDFIDSFWPSQSDTLDPDLADQTGRYWAPVGVNSVSPSQFNTIVVAPTPTTLHTAECTGLFQPTPLSTGNQTTYLSTIYPDLLTAACMVYLEGALKRNFGSQADDPRQAVSWEGQYQVLKKACEFEEARKRGLTHDVPRPPAPVPPS